jgi:TRAP-type transport system small permease protein
LGGLLDRLLRGAALLSGVLLAGLTLLTVLDVARRYALNAPLVGALELTQLAMLCLVMLALPWCWATDGHVRIDVLDGVLGAHGRALADVLTSVVGLAVIAALTWNTAWKAADALEFDDRANTLLTPLWPFYALIATSFAASGLVLARNLLRRLRG